MMARALARLMTCGIQLRLSHVWMRVARQDIYIYKILCLILWLQRCSGAALACVGSTDLFACTFVGTMVGTYPIRTV